MKKLILALPFTLLAGQALAVEPLDKQVTVTALIPTEEFYVEPASGNWMNEPIAMTWRPASGSTPGKLVDVRNQLVVKSTTGAISAYLLAPAEMVSGSNSIGLDILVGDKVLTVTKDEVVNAANAASGATVDFVVKAKAPTAPGNKYAPGNYMAVVNMMFETVTPAP